MNRVCGYLGIERLKYFPSDKCVFCKINKTFMKNKHLALLLVAIYLVSCFPFKSLHSTTYIKANDEFILGNNFHGKFYAHVTNISNFEVTIWQYPNDGGRHSPITLKPSMSVKVAVDKNTSLRFENHSNEEVAVKLHVRGDVGLSMGYKK